MPQKNAKYITCFGRCGGLSRFESTNGSASSQSSYRCGNKSFLSSAYANRSYSFDISCNGFQRRDRSFACQHGKNSLSGCWKLPRSQSGACFACFTRNGSAIYQSQWVSLSRNCCLCGCGTSGGL